MITTVTIYPKKSIAADAARLEAGLMQTTDIRINPFPRVRKGQTEALFLSVDELDKLRGLEIRNWYTHYDVNLTQDQVEFLNSRKRG